MLKKEGIKVRAVKANREYTITEAEKDFYQKQGFDIINDNGNVIQYGAGKTVPYEQYKKVVDELEALKNGTKHKELEEMTKPELEEVAKAYDVEYDSKTTKPELIKLIKATAGYKTEEE